MKTAHLGAAWYGNANDDGSFTIRNPDKGLRIDLTAEEAARFVDLYREAERQCWEALKATRDMAAPHA